MDSKLLDSTIATIRRRMVDLEERCGLAPDSEYERMLKEVEAALATLRDAGDALRAQNAAILASQTTIAEERRHYYELFEHAPDGYVVTDAAGVIRAANQAAADMFGVAREALPGTPLAAYIAASHRQAFATLARHLGRGGRVSGWEAPLEQAGGSNAFFASVTAVAVHAVTGEPTDIRWMLHDTTKRHRAEAAVQRYVKRLEVLGQMDRAMLSASSLRDTCEIALGHLQRLITCPRASVVLIDAATGAMRIVAVVIEGTTAVPEGATQRIDPADVVPSRGQWRVVEDTFAMAEPSPWVRTMREEGVRTIINVPLNAQEELLGTLNLGLESLDQLGDEDREVVQEVANRLAVAVQQSRLIQQARQHTRELERRVEERTAELQASEERLRLVLDQLPALVWTTDRDLNITSASGSGLRLARLSRDRLVGRNLRDYQRLARHPVSAIAMHERVLRGEQVTYEAEFRGHVYHSHVEPFFDGRDTIVGCLGVAMDVTPLKRTEAALRETSDRLEAINERLQALNTIELGAQELLEVDDITALVVQRLAALHIQAAVLLRQDGHLAVRSTSLEAATLARVECILGVSIVGPLSTAAAGSWLLQPETRQTTWVPDAVALMTEMMPHVAPQAVAEAARAADVRGAIVSPLVARGSNIGVLLLWGDNIAERDVPAVAGFANRLAVTIDNAVLFATIRHQGDRLRVMAARLAEVEEADRRLVVRALHDKVGQNLSALNLSLSAVREQVRSLPAEVAPLYQQRIDDALSLLRETAVRARDIMADLRPPVLDDYGLMAALRWYAEELECRFGLSVTVRGREPEPRLHSPIAIALLRIAQEALVNVALHADTAKAWVHVETAADSVRLRVEDHGAGFDPAAVAAQDERSRWGLLTIEERATAVGGHARIESQPGEGTRFTVEVPR